MMLLPMPLWRGAVLSEQLGDEHGTGVGSASADARSIMSSTDPVGRSSSHRSGATFQVEPFACAAVAFAAGTSGASTEVGAEWVQADGTQGESGLQRCVSDVVMQCVGRGGADVAIRHTAARRLYYVIAASGFCAFSDLRPGL